MSDDNNSDKPDNNDNIVKLLAEWPVLDTLDFEGVSVDVTEWDKDAYTVTLNFHMASETGEPPYSGYSLCTQMGGESLREVWERVDVLLSIGFFDGVQVSSTGTIWSADGDEIGTVDWNDYAEEDDDADDEDTVEPPSTLH